MPRKKKLAKIKAFSSFLEIDCKNEKKSDIPSAAIMVNDIHVEGFGSKSNFQADISHSYNSNGGISQTVTHNIHGVKLWVIILHCTMDTCKMQIKCFNYCSVLSSLVDLQDLSHYLVLVT